MRLSFWSFVRSIALLILLPGAVRAQEAPALRLRPLLEEALANNPFLRAAGRGLEVAVARISQAGALPDPVLSYGVANEGRPLPFQTLGEAEFSEVYVGIMQDIPYPGKRALKEKIAREEAGASEWVLESAKRRVVAQVKETYYDLYAVHAARDVVNESQKLLESLERIAAARFSVGQGTQQDVLDAEIELSRLEERRSLLERERMVVEARLRSLLYRDTGALQGRPLALRVDELRYELPDLLRMARESSPALKDREYRIAAGEQALALARRERLPDLGLNFIYHNRGALDPYYTFGGILTLPIYSGRKQQKGIEEATARLAEARHGRDAVEAEVNYEVATGHSMAKTSERVLRLYAEGILPQARLSLDSASAQYQVGRIDFLTLLTSWKRLLEHELSYHQQLAEHEKALARIEPHVGLELTGAPEGEAQ